MIHVILLAAGESRRFGGNKLLCEFEGKPLYRHMLEVLCVLADRRGDVDLRVVTQYEDIAEVAEMKGVSVSWNDRSYLGITSSLKVGVLDAEHVGQGDFYAFFAADQPHLKIDTIEGFIEGFLESGKSMGCLSFEGRWGNPCIFHGKYRDELLALEGDMGGKQLFLTYPGEVFTWEAGMKLELVDYDEKW